MARSGTFGHFAHVTDEHPDRVFIGLSTHDYLGMASDELSYSEVDAYLAIGTAAAAGAGRISYRMGLQGPAVTVDTACSLSLVAIHQGCQALRLGEADLVLAGGANVLLSPATMITFSQSRMLAPDGKCKTFDVSSTPCWRPAPATSSPPAKPIRGVQEENLGPD